MYFMGRDIDWDFSATYRSKWEMMVCVEHAKGEDVKKTISHTIGLQNSVEFAKYPAAISKGITILYCTKNGAKTCLIRPSALTMELFIAFLEHEKHTFSSKVLPTQLVSKK